MSASLQSCITAAANLSTDQLKAHGPENPSKGAEHPSNQLVGSIPDKYKKSAWLCSGKEKIALLETVDDGTVTYKFNNEWHGIDSSTILQDLPEIVCKEGYQVCWVHNLASNIILVATHGHNTKHIQYIHTEMYDALLQFGPDRSLDIGNISSLRTYQSLMPANQLSFELPWSYNIPGSPFYPLYQTNINDKVYHSLVLQRDLSKLTMVRRLSDGEQVAFNEDSILFVNNKSYSDTYKLPVPEMWAEYVILSKVELDFFRCNSTITYTLDMIDFSFDITTEQKKEVVVTIPTRTAPIHTIYWMARNNELTRLRGKSCYITADGRSSIESVTLETSNGVRYKDIPYRITSRPNTKHGMDRPREEGYNKLTLAPPHPHKGYPSGEVMKEAKFKLNMKDTTSDYTIKLMTVYTAKVTFSDIPLNEKERVTKTSTITLS